MTAQTAMERTEHAPAESPAIEQPLRSLAGWGRYPVERCRLYEPSSTGQAGALLETSHESTFVPRGLGRAYGDAALNRGAGVLSALAFNRVLAFDAETGILECEAGLSLDQIIRRFLPLGFFLPVTPGTRQVTVGGAIAADVHGKNHHVAGSFANFVLDFDLVTGDGQALACSRETHPEVFRATTGGMGLTGLIARARIRLRRVESAYLSVHFAKAGSLVEGLQRLEAGDRQYEYSVAWVDCLARGARQGRAVVMLGRHAGGDELPGRVGDRLRLDERRGLNAPFVAPVSPLRAWAVRAFNALYFGSKPANSVRMVDLNRFFYPLDALRNWNRLYGPRGFVQYQVVVPHEAAPAALAGVLDRLAASGRGPFLGVLKRFGEASEGMLSFPRPGATLALDIAVDRGVPALLRELDDLIVDHGGRVYLAKDATQSAATFARGYPRLDEFRAVQGRVDPRRRISSSLARRLGIVDG
jgi:decaprenylphospho-beta-D-ribofuranose 2-oxidase